MRLLSVRGLACERGERLVFSGLDFTLDAGEALHLTGPNGSGKSSLLRLLAGFGVPAQGEILWDGGSIAGDPAAHRQRLSYVGHLDGLKAPLSVGANLAFLAALFGSAGKVEEALAQLEIGWIADRPVRHLSAGQRRRVCLAGLLLRPSRLWLLDEPTNALDQDGQALTEALIGAHLASGGLAIVASHDKIALGSAKHIDLGHIDLGHIDLGGVAR